MMVLVYIQEGECDCDGNIDVDFDGICDNEDDCVGEYDNCGLCNGPENMFAGWFSRL